MISKGSESFVHDLQTWRGLKLVLSFLHFTFWLVILVFTSGEPTNLTANLGRTWFLFAVFYWSAHLQVLILYTCFITLFYTQLFYRLARPLFPRVRPTPSKDSTRRRFRQFYVAFGVLSAGFAFFAIPFASLHWVEVGLLFGQLLVLPIGVAAFSWLTNSDQGKEERIQAVFRISTNDLYFNSAGRSPKFDEKIVFLRKMDSISTSTGDTWEKLMEGGSPAAQNTEWKGMETLFSQLAALVGCPDKTRLCFHASTTDAIVDACRQSLERIRSEQGSVRLVLTDADYPGIHVRLRDLAKELGIGEPIMLPFLKTALGRSNPGEFAEMVDCLPADPFVLCMPYVHFYTGFIFPVSDFLKVISISLDKGEGVSMVAIVDGAQAVGNIEVDVTTMPLNVFFAFSSHKWLLSDPARGVLCWSPEINGWYRKPSSPYSYYGQKDSMGPMTSTESLFSLALGLNKLGELEPKALAKHNAQLAAMFARKVRQIGGIEVLRNDKYGSGIVCLHLSQGDKNEELGTALEKLNVQVACYDSEIKDLPQREDLFDFARRQRDFAGVRISFHGYHDSESVDMLLARLETALDRIHY